MYILTSYYFIQRLLHDALLQTLISVISRCLSQVETLHFLLRKIPVLCLLPCANFLFDAMTC